MRGESLLECRVKGKEKWGMQQTRGVYAVEYSLTEQDGHKLLDYVVRQKKAELRGGRKKFLVDIGSGEGEGGSERFGLERERTLRASRKTKGLNGDGLGKVQRSSKKL